MDVKVLDHFIVAGTAQALSFRSVACSESEKTLDRTQAYSLELRAFL